MKNTNIGLLDKPDLHELEFNSQLLRRICSSTHCDEDQVALAVKFAQLLAKILQGSSPSTLLEQEEPEGNQAGVMGLLLDNLELFEKSGFREVITNVVMMGGEATLNGFVVGAVFGALHGFQSLPNNWIQNLEEEFREMLDKKLNGLLDLMGVP